MLQKIFTWYEENRAWIEKILSVAAIVELFIIVLLFVAIRSMEVLLAAHGVEWALYTPIL